MTKQLIFSDDARQKMLAGINQLADAVTTTLGPKGRNVAIDKSWGAPTVLHDGVSVAKEITLEDKFENMGAQLVKEAASRTNDATGDGTTTATLLTQKIVSEGMRHIISGSNPMLMKIGIDKAVETVISEIKKLAKPVKKSDWEKVATISAQNEVIGKKVAEALSLVGENGVIEVEEGNTPDIKITHKEGMEFDKGYISPYFATDENVALLKTPYILITDHDLNSIQDLIPLLEKVGGKELVIIANSINEETLKALVINKLRGSLNVLVVHPPSFGSSRIGVLEDIAVLTGGELISKEKGMEIKEVSLEQLGKAESVKSLKDSTTILGGQGSKESIDKRVALINNLIKESSSEFDQQKLQERKAKLTGGVAVIQVGAYSEVEMKNLKERIIDAKGSTMSAIEEGIIPGGGVVLIHASKVLNNLKSFSKDEQVGIDIIKKISSEPLRKLAENSGEDGGWVVKTIMNQNDPLYGFNATTNEFGNLIEMGVIEPAKVAIESLKNSSSVASMVLTTECLITDTEEKDTV